MTYLQTTSSSDNILQSLSTEPKPTKTPNECKVCGVPATVSCFGVIVCPSCKMFFKRNAENKQKELKCHFDGHCEININTRHVCAHCRLAKCIAVGMQVELIRSSTPRKAKKPKTEIVQSNKLELIPTLNLLQADSSTLSIDQWNLLSNLVHCYDEHSNFHMAHQYLAEQKKLSDDMRFKSDGMNELFVYLSAGAQLLFEKNADFLLLYPQDRSLLLENTIRQTAGMGGCFTIYQTKLFDNSVFYRNCESFYGQRSLSCAYRAVELLGSDIVFIKLILAILMFVPFDYTYYANTSPVYLIDLDAILRVQDTYIELVWRYLLYKYDHRQAVLLFSNLIRSVFMFNSSIEAAGEVQEYNKMIDSIVEQTELSLGRLD